MLVVRKTAEYRLRMGISDPDSESNLVVRRTVVGENELHSNVPIRPGMSETMDLRCNIPVTHKTPTVVSARHIKISYHLEVRVILDGRSEVVVDKIPMTMSPWPRFVLHIFSL
ncbi:hypothetical protein DL93DRAFT_2082428 [Clavulina sp. PMI_390]|nr:hypothetical protein DL93DRAFT_2082428 [Clavulina sp. PMI_390]